MMKIHIRLRLVLYLAAVTLFAVGAKSQESAVSPVNPLSTTLPPAPGQVITLTPEAGFHNEPSIAVKPRESCRRSWPPTRFRRRWPSRAMAVIRGRSRLARRPPTTACQATSPSPTTSTARRSSATSRSTSWAPTNYWARGATRNGIFVRRSRGRRRDLGRAGARRHRAADQAGYSLRGQALHRRRQHQQQVRRQPLRRLDRVPH